MNDMTNTVNILKEKVIGFAMDFGPKIIGALVILIVGLWVIGKITKFASNRIAKSKIDATLAPFFTNMLNAILKVLLVLTVVGILGVQTTSFAAIIAAAGLAIGLALQGSLGNFAGGVLLLIFRPISVGDYIKAQSHEGEVKEILLFVTVLKTLDKRIVYLPNGALAGGPIENLSREGSRRVDTTFRVAGDQDIDAARAAFLEGVNNCKHVLKDPAPQIVVNVLTEYAIEFQVRPFCKPEVYWDAWVEIQEQVKKSLVKNSIKGPTPGRNIFMHNA